MYGIASAAYETGSGATYIIVERFVLYIVRGDKSGLIHQSFDLLALFAIEFSDLLPPKDLDLRSCKLELARKSVIWTE